MRSQQAEGCPARSATVAVVDPRPADYRVLLGAPPGAMRMRLLSCGRDALRLAQSEEVDLWVIHLVLPDMSGLQLCEILKTRLSRPVIYIVSEDYRAEDERAARAGGASLFSCKPVQAWWFEPWTGSLKPDKKPDGMIGRTPSFGPRERRNKAG